MLCLVNYMGNLFDNCDITMVCPHCGVKSHHIYLNKIYGQYEFVVDFTYPQVSSSFKLSGFDAVKCMSCGSYSIYYQGHMIYPLTSEGSQPNEFMSNNIKKLKKKK